MKFAWAAQCIRAAHACNGDRSATTASSRHGGLPLALSRTSIHPNRCCRYIRWMATALRFRAAALLALPMLACVGPGAPAQRDSPTAPPAALADVTEGAIVHAVD